MSRHLVFALMLTTLLLVAGAVMVPATQGMAHADRNILYGLVRVPVILGGVWAFYGRSMNPRRVIGFALMLSLVMMGTGVMSIPAASGFDPTWQNLAYAVGRVPLIYVMAYLVFGGCSTRPARGEQWKRRT